MTYLELYEHALRDLEHSKITLGEFEERIKPLKQEIKTGYWVGRKKIGFGEWKDCIVPLKDGFVTSSCSCSECGEWLTGSDEYPCFGNYCPNCGARMIEPQESEVTECQK